MPKHLKPAASQIFLRVYDKYKGKWPDIMADPEVKALNVERHRLENHLSYLKRKKTKLKEKQRTSESDDEDEEENTDSFDEENEEFELVAITGRKKGVNQNETKWYAVYSDGDERWVPRNCFVDLDGTTSDLFLKFQANHPGNEDVKLSNSLKRPYGTIIQESPKSPPIPQKKLKVQKETIVLPREEEKEKIRIKIPSSPLDTTSSTVTDKKTRRLQCLKMIQQIMEDEDLLEEEITLLKKEMSEMKLKFSLSLKELTESQQQLLTLIKQMHTNGHK